MRRRLYAVSFIDRLRVEVEGVLPRGTQVSNEVATTEDLIKTARAQREAIATGDHDWTDSGLWNWRNSIEEYDSAIDEAKRYIDGLRRDLYRGNNVPDNYEAIANEYEHLPADLAGIVRAGELESAMRQRLSTDCGLDANLLG